MDNAKERKFLITNEDGMIRREVWASTSRWMDLVQAPGERVHPTDDYREKPAAADVPSYVQKQQASSLAEPFVTKDSGARAEYPTGCVRDTTTGKGSFVSVSPHMLRRLAELLERGAIKYYLFNYQKGMPFSRCFDSLMRHTNQAFMGDKSEDHLAASIFNAMCLIHFEEEIAAGHLPAELNDLPRYTK